MKFYQRLAYYSIGFTLGMFFVIAIWSGKDTRCNYFPNSRVLNDLRNKPFHYSAKADSILNQGWIDKEDIKLILTQGDVDFDRSNTKGNGPRTYVVEGETKTQKTVELLITNKSDKAILETITKIDNP